LSTQLIHFNSL
jgi:diadenosine tetraphosphate (Ap4A) HIT family hydrolase